MTIIFILKDMFWTISTRIDPANEQGIANNIKGAGIEPDMTQMDANQKQLNECVC